MVVQSGNFGGRISKFRRSGENSGGDVIGAFILALFLARSAGVRMLALSHLTQAGMPGFPETFTQGVEEGIEDGGELDWRLAEDGMMIELPAGGNEIMVSER